MKHISREATRVEQSRLCHTKTRNAQISRISDLTYWSIFNNWILQIKMLTFTEHMLWNQRPFWSSAFCTCTWKKAGFMVTWHSEVSPHVIVETCLEGNLSNIMSGFCITKTRLYNFDPLKPHFFYSKTGVYRGKHYFSYFWSKHRLWVLVRTASSRRF